MSRWSFVVALVAFALAASDARGGKKCSGSCSQVALSFADVETIVAQGAAQAQTLGLPATIAVLDHVGNVLAVFEMTGAETSIRITTMRGVESGLEAPAVNGILAQTRFAAALAAISKAGTAAYLSTQGNAFSSRTANQIVQENFNPKETDRPGGPLFGVQFSQLPCGDLVRRFPGDGQLGPKRMPLGFSADPGGIPLYLGGVPVGGVGVEADGVYSVDPVITDKDANLEERIATAAARSFRAPKNRRANRISVDGRFLRYADDERARRGRGPVVPPQGSFLALPDFTSGVPEAGVVFQTPESGIVATIFEGIEAEVLVDASGSVIYAPTDSSAPPVASGGLTSDEVRVVLREALAVAERSRAQIRRPASSKARVTISVVDTAGAVLGIVRSRDAPIFGIDVSLQKARAASFFSVSSAAQDLEAAGFGSYADAFRAFTGADLDGTVALSNRAIGNLARPFYPDGINGNRPGPFSRPFDDWSPFSTGLQLDLVFEGIVAALCPLLATCPIVPPPVPPEPTSCTDPALSEIKNGIQIFPGSVPIYGDDGALVGGVGVSGDGVDQDDLVAFLGLHQAGLALGGSIGNAPRPMRADTLDPGGVHLRYANCPVAPFRKSRAQNVCEGL